MRRKKTLLFALSWLCAFYYLSYPNALKSLYKGNQATIDTHRQVTSRSR